jgi:hypothetical protein
MPTARITEGIMKRVASIQFNSAVDIRIPKIRTGA